MVIPIIIQQLPKILPAISRVLRAQGRVIDYTYTRPFLRRNINPSVRRGIKHGLAGGQVLGGLQELNSVGDFIVPDVIPQPRSKITSSQKRKTRNFMVSSRRKRNYCPDSQSYRRRPR